ncbi:MAG: DinB family protein [Cyclobacteriaceae bacterium]|nr:DinB family protein [Cyclobacteriaceae bacterium]
MTKAELQQQLRIHYSAFIESINSLDEVTFTLSKNEKWTAGQQLDHLIRSTEPVMVVMKLPTLLIRLLFGKANRTSQPYETLVTRYLEKLAAGGKATGRYIPGQVVFSDRTLLTTRLDATIHKLAEQLNKFTEEDLDKFILPHPILGKLTYREMIYFTIYHVQHHHKLLNKY